MNQGTTFKMLHKITNVRDNQFSYILSTKYSFLLLKLMRLWFTYKCMQLAFCFVLFSFCFLVITYDCKAPSTLIRFETKTELFCSGYGYRSHYNPENDHRKTEPFENALQSGAI